MSNLGYVSRSTSPGEEFSLQIVEHSGSPWASPGIRDLTKSPSPQKDLRIDVLKATEHTDNQGLGEAFLFDGSDPLPLPDFNNITQLPTPVLPAGSFQLTSPTKMGTLGTLGVRKRNMAPLHSGLERSRIVSAIDPETHSKLRMALSPGLAKTMLPTRHISNPIVMPASAPPLEMPLPPPDSDTFAYRGRVLITPASGHSYVCEEVIGTGAFSTVVSACSTDDPQRVVAVKIISYPQDDCTSLSSFRSFIIRELGILSHVHHPCIIDLIDYNVVPSITPTEIRASYDLGDASVASTEDLLEIAQAKQYFFLEFCRGGNLFNWLLSNYKAFSDTQAFWRLTARMVAELVVAVAHMHRRRIIHRDIKLENILLNENYDCLALYEDPRLLSRPITTITDFGLSKRLASDDQLLTTKCGSQDYVSPELLMGLKYNGKLLDAWAIGVLIYSVVENRLPFDAPPIEFAQTAGISPSVLKRRRSKHSPAHRIAMIDWDWYRAAAMQQDNALDGESKKIIMNLQALVEVFLVRKEKRMLVEEVLELEQFAWIKASVPSQFYS